MCSIYSAQITHTKKNPNPYAALESTVMLLLITVLVLNRRRDKVKLRRAVFSKYNH